IEMRDVDVPLSTLGEEQARAAGRWFAALPRNERPEIILSSPYVRAKQTAALICKEGALAGGPARTIVDERLREREFGIFDRLTTAGIRHKFPEEAAHRRWLGKFYHRPPGGESWADVVLRVRSFVNDLEAVADGTRALVVCHDALVLSFRYVCERLDEAEILAVGASTPVRNVSITQLVRLAALRVGAGHLTLAIADQVAVAMAVATPEAGVIGLPTTDQGSVIGAELTPLEDTLGSSDVVVVGPGLDEPEHTAELVRR